MKKKPKYRRQAVKAFKKRASKREKAALMPAMPETLRKPEGDLAMMLQQMRDAELAAQTQAERAVKIRARIVQFLRDRRLAGNVPVADVAATIGRHVTSLVRIETGVVKAKDTTLQKIMAFHGFDWIPTPKVFTSDPNGPRHRTE